MTVAATKASTRSSPRRPPRVRASRLNEEFVFIDADHIASVDRNVPLGVVRDASGAVVALTHDS